MIVETTNYYAKPGQRDAVLEHRRNGSRLRRAMGLNPGRIFVNTGGQGPDVRWECEFASAGELQDDLVARDKSPEFAQQRQHMTELTDRFERHVFVRDEISLDTE